MREGEKGGKERARVEGEGVGRAFSKPTPCAAQAVPGLAAQAGDRGGKMNWATIGPAREVAAQLRKAKFFSFILRQWAAQCWAIGPR